MYPFGDSPGNGRTMRRTDEPPPNPFNGPPGSVVPPPPGGPGGIASERTSPGVTAVAQGMPGGGQPLPGAGMGPLVGQPPMAPPMPGMAGPPPAGPQQAPAPGTAPGMPGSDLSGIVQMGQAISEGILTLSQVLPQSSALLQQANELVMQALSQHVQAASSAALSPGPQFPGGGLGGGSF